MINALAAAVIATINASGLLEVGQAAVRRIIPTLDVEATAVRQVLVITPAIERGPQNRSQFRNTFTLQIGLLEQVPTLDAADVEPLIDLAEGLLNLRYAKVTDAGREAGYLLSTATPLYDAERLEQAHQFASVITVQFLEFQGE